MGMSISVEQLPDGEYREVLEEAMERGLSVAGSDKNWSLDGNLLLIIGLADIIREMKEAAQPDWRD